MPDVRPFPAFRYDLSQVGALSDVVAPPYDVIDSELQEALYRRHPQNAIRLILNREEPGDNELHNRYTRAARFLKDWRQAGVLRQDAAPALYIYHQTYRVEGRELTRRGVLARVRLEAFGQGRIYPHEETMPGPKADRLKLMQATAMNLSPVFGLYPDAANEIQNRLDEAVRRTLPLEATDHLGTVSRLWPLTNSGPIREAQRLFQDRPVFIADGHHRYETALRYREERAPRDSDEAPNFILMMLVGMSDPGLLILPTHRLVSGLPPLTADQLRSILQGPFAVETVGQGEAAARAAWERIEAEAAQEWLGFGTVADGVWQLARFQSPDRMAELAPEHSPAWRKLGVSILHVLVLNRLFKDQGMAPACKYVHLLDEVLAAARGKECQVAALVPAAQMSHVEQIAGNLEKMPPKSTYFYPKLLSGLVFNPL